MNREINFVFCFIISTTKNDIKKLILFSYFVKVSVIRKSEYELICVDFRVSLFRMLNEKGKDGIYTDPPESLVFKLTISNSKSIIPV